MGVGGREGERVSGGEEDGVLEEAVEDLECGIREAIRLGEDLLLDPSVTVS